MIITDLTNALHMSLPQARLVQSMQTRHTYFIHISISSPISTNVFQVVSFHPVHLVLLSSTHMCYKPYQPTSLSLMSSPNPVHRTTQSSRSLHRSSSRFSQHILFQH